MNGYPLLHPGAGISGQTKNLYKVLNGMGYKPFEVTEASAAPLTSMSPSAPTVAPATPPPACASASRATATTTATPRTCSPPRLACSSTASALATDSACHWRLVLKC